MVLDEPMRRKDDLMGEKKRNWSIRVKQRQQQHELRMMMRINKVLRCRRSALVFRPWSTSQHNRYKIQFSSSVLYPPLMMRRDTILSVLISFRFRSCEIDPCELEDSKNSKTIHLSENRRASKKLPNDQPAMPTTMMFSISPWWLPGYRNFSS